MALASDTLVGAILRQRLLPRERPVTPDSEAMSRTELDNRQRRQLRSLAHALKPVVMVGQQGVTTGVRRELDIALSHHELVKIRLPGGDREERDRMLESLRHDSGAQLVQQTGHVAVLFRRNRRQPVIRFED